MSKPLDLMLSTLQASADDRGKKITKTIGKFLFKIAEFHDHIWNHHEKCIDIAWYCFINS